ncbi:hypothetical protein HP456_15850 [Bacillus haikouensis]|uniref:hypothetical protein n=1 Tax=Bacillus haikouensis TaxID=1510468 RepID=UPI001553986A|nr:hypothetical protein [Bacillus haikouensis]NQD67389.1 hypothetical protein [Bacillus haikouensis]
MEALFFSIIVFVLGISNFIVFKVSGKNKKKRILSGAVCILLTPVIFFITAVSISPFDPYGFGTGIISVLYSALFFINGIVILIIGLITKR